MLVVLRDLRPYVVLSGGWAWHFMSPVGHVELKHAHDHKDADLMVPPRMVPVVLALLTRAGFAKVQTVYDRLPSPEEFRRYERTDEIEGERPIRLTIDFFVRDVPEREVDGWRVVDPATLITLYSSIHASKNCFAVVAAQRLLAAGVDPVGHPALVEIPRE